MAKLQMSASEIKLMLRKLDFPFCAREALTCVEQLIMFLSGGRLPNTKAMEHAMELTAEFVFCEVDRRGGKKRPFTKIQELQLMEVLCDHFLLSGQSSVSGGLESIRSYLFSALFPPPAPASPSQSASGRTLQTLEARINLLCKLVSLAVATRNVPLLSTVGSWMAQAGGGATAVQSVRLSQCLVRDYIVLVPRSISRLKDLPFLAPLFAAHFLAAISEIYAGLERGNAFNPPPEPLLEIVTQWVGESAQLCLGPLVTLPSQPQRSSTPPTTPSRVQMQPGQSSPKTMSPPVASSCSPPFAALFKWCIIAPLHLFTAKPKKSYLSSNSSLNNGHTIFGRESQVNRCGSEGTRIQGEMTLYSQLHLALLQAMLQLFLEQGAGSGSSLQSSSLKVSQQPRKQQPSQQPLPPQLLQPQSAQNPEVISASQMRSIADELEIHRRRILACTGDIEVDAEKDAVVQLALDRLGQALQVSLATGCLYGDRGELFERLSLLPQNRLINIVISKHSPHPG